MRRDPRAQRVVRLRRARRTRAAGRFYGTQTTAYGDVRDVRVISRQSDAGRIVLALVLMVGLTGVLLCVVGQVEVATWLHLVVHAVRLDPGAPLPVQ